VSLILDALRKADAERQQGQVPGLHAQPTAALPTEPADPAPTSRWRWPVVAAVVVCVSAAAAWFFLSREPSELAASPAARQVVPPPPPALSSAPPAIGPGAPVVAAPNATPPAMDQNPGRTDAARAEPPKESADVAEPAPWPARESRKGQAATAAQPTTPRGSPAPSVAGTKGGASAPEAAAANPPATPIASAPAIFEREQLPQEMRAALPPLVVSGAIYSPRAQDRTLIVDGRLYRENDAIAPNLSLERIEQKSAIFRYRGYRFQVMF